jgi:hypothetical protein
MEHPEEAKKKRDRSIRETDRWLKDHEEKLKTLKKIDDVDPTES